MLGSMTTHYSLWLKLQRHAAWLVRFCHQVKHRKTSPNTGTALTKAGLREVTLLIMGLVQIQSFAEWLRDQQECKEFQQTHEI